MRHQGRGITKFPVVLNYQRGQNVLQKDTKQGSLQAEVWCNCSLKLRSSHYTQSKISYYSTWQTRSLQKKNNERKDKGGKTSESCRWKVSHQRGVKPLWWWAHHMRFTNISQCQLTFPGIYMLYCTFQSQALNSDPFKHFIFHLFLFFLLSVSPILPCNQSIS